MFNKNDWPIGFSLKTYGEFSWREVEVFRKLISGGVVVDVGANIGTHTVEFARLAGVVVAFEPQRIAFQTLCANLALNHITNVVTFQAAMGKENWRITCPTRDQNAKNNFGGVPLAGVTEGEAVELIKLDRLAFGRCDFLKIDVEGMEADVLRGGYETILTHRPIIYIEADGAQALESRQILFDWKYDCYWHFPALFNPKNFAGITEDLFSKDTKLSCSVNMVCFPEEKQVPCNLKRVSLSDEWGAVSEELLKTGALVG